VVSRRSSRNKNCTWDKPTVELADVFIIEYGSHKDEENENEAEEEGSKVQKEDRSDTLLLPNRKVGEKNSVKKPESLEIKYSYQLFMTSGHIKLKNWIV
jgi:hypothetical protein